MKPAEVMEVLIARNDAIEKHLHSGDIGKAAEFYHEDAVLVLRGVSASYGKAQIRDALQKMWDQTGPQTFTKSNEKYEGCEDFLVLICDCTMHSAKRGAEPSKLTQIWRKDSHGAWVLYHEEIDATK
ncbi:unnamed protein product [Nippostrongylus brasiliensis]|uniref:DUF4440 domain-containing protein n=1 Tax=Nippostrongylus brasiliensis TaxID=27835 RepID=A0A0N4Y9A4_NIPBR|nr:unnamed protein product [Nippostrongylus brasiliensis]